MNGIQKAAISVCFAVCENLAFAPRVWASALPAASAAPVGTLVCLPQPVYWGVGAALLAAAAVLILIHTHVFRRRALRQRADANLSRLDELTGLLNKRTFLNEAQRLLSAAPAGSYAIMRWDIDRFRVYNDLFGPKAGDKLLQDIGAYILAHPEQFKAHAVARLEGDHFAGCVRCEDLDPEELLSLLERMLEQTHPDFHCVAHMGIYRVDDPTLDVNLMCDRALLALRSTKGSIARQFAWYDESMREAENREQARLTEIVDALHRGEFGIYIQPQYDQYENAVSGAEALARWFHPTRGVLAPSEFIPIMEKNRLISSLDEIIWEQAAAFLASIRDHAPLLSISVNISRLNLYNAGLVEKLCGIVERHGVLPQQLHLEITETVYMSHTEQFVSTVGALREKGFVVEMDDFGSEYSSLNTLKALPVDLLKLDMKFLASDVDQSSNGGIILSSVIRMAHWLDLHVIAEGVETQQQATYLKSIGCRYAQGYFYARPMSLEDFKVLLQAQPVSPLTNESFTESFFNGADFWKPDSQATTIFNTLVGAAGIFEYYGGKVECICINDSYVETIAASRHSIFRYKNAVLDLLCEEDRQQLLDTLSRAKDSSAEFSLDLRYRPLDAEKKLIWLHVRLRRIAHSIDRTAFYAALENITAQKETELRLRRENEFSRLLMACSGVYTFAYTFETDTLILQHVSKDGELIKETLEHESTRLPEAEYLHPEDRSRVQALFHGDASPLRNGSMDCRVKWKGRTAFLWRRITYRTVVDSNGAPVRVVGQVEDIEAEKHREAQLEKLSHDLGRQGISYDPDIAEQVFQHLYEATDIHAAISNVLQALGEHFHVSRVSIFEDSADHCRCSVTYEWCAPGITPGHAARDLDYGHWGGREAYLQRFDQNGVYLIGDTGSLDVDTQAILKQYHVRSTLQCAIYHANEFAGVMTFDDCCEARDWAPQLVGTMTLLSRIIGVFLTRVREQNAAVFSEDFLEAIDQNSSLIYIADPKSCEMVYANKRVRNYLGRSGTGERCHKVFMGSDVPCAGCPMRLYAQTGEKRAVEFQRADGTWILAQATPIHWQGRDLVMLFCTDITAQKQSEAALRINADVLRLSMEQMGKNIAIYHIPTRTLQLPEAFAQSWGVSPTIPDVPEAMISLLGMEPQSPEAQRYQAFYAAIQRGEATGSGEFVFPSRDGKARFWYQFESATVFGEDGAPVQAVIAFEDTTEQHERERSARLSYSQLFAAVQSAYPLALSVNLTKNTYSTISRKGYPIQKFPPAGNYEALSSLCLRRLRPEDHDAFLKKYSRQFLLDAFSSGTRGIRAEFLQLCDDGVWHWIGILSLLVESPDSEDHLCVFLAQEIDSQKALEEQLRAALAQASGELERERSNLQLINANVIAGVMIYYPDEQQIHYIGGNLLQSYGYSEEEIETFRAENLKGLIYEPDFAASSNLIRQEASRKTRYLEQEYRMVKKDGTHTWVFVKSTLTHDSAGALVYVSVAVDITERKQMERQLQENEQFMRLVSTLSDRVVYRYDILSKALTALDPDACQRHGLPSIWEDIPEDAIAKNLFLPESHEAVRRFFTAIQEGRPSGRARFHIRLEPKGKHRWFEARFLTFCPEGGGQTAVVSYLDIDDSYEKEMAFSRYQTSIQNSIRDHLAYLEIDLTANTVERQGGGMFTRAAYMVGWTYDAAADYILETFFLPEARRAAEQFISRDSLLERARTDASDIKQDFQIQYFDEGTCWILVELQFFRDPFTDHWMIFSKFSDITEERTRSQKMRDRAERDGMTGVFNKDTIEHLVRHQLRVDHGREAMLLMIDMDNLKSINDTLGHAEGDRAITALATLLRSSFRETDLVGRVGGDEFMVLLLDIGDEAIMRRLLDGLMCRAADLRVGEQNDMPVRCSIGVTPVICGQTEFDTAYRQADRALYHIKRQQKNAYAFYTPDLEAR